MNEDEERPDTDLHARSMGEGALVSAARHLARSAGASRSGDGSRSQFSASFEAFVEWGQASGLVRPSSDFPFFQRPPDGHGDEHEAWFDEATNKWFKATYPNQFGLGWIGASATAKEYLDRLLLQNAYFGDRIELVALVSCAGKLRVLTSQPHVAGGPAPYHEIEQWLQNLGFKRIETEGGAVAWYLAAENLLVADAHEGNVLRSGDLLLPIDLNLIQPTGEMLAWVQQQGGVHDPQGGA